MAMVAVSVYVMAVLMMLSLSNGNGGCISVFDGSVDDVESE